jgi:Fur family transcriptional regulator, ferric uptake regulator
MPEDNMSKAMGTDPLAAANALLATLPGRRTRGRAHILAALINARHALTHTEIEAVLPPDVVLDRVTLYRILEWLNEHNMVHRVAGADRAVRFAFTGDNSSVASQAEMHAHFQCDTCGRVVCLNTVHTQLPKLENGFSARKADVLVHGQCDQCGNGKPKIVRDSVAD